MHQNNHKKLKVRMEPVEAIMEQLAGSKYNSLDVYVNNMHIVSDFYRDAGDYLKDPDFLIYLFENDRIFYINILSLGNSIKLMRNFLLNFKHIIDSIHST